MDYTGFIRHYYVSVINGLNKYADYNGERAFLNKPLPIDIKSLHATKEPNFSGLPAFSVNIDSPTSDFESFIEYYGETMPDLAVALPNRASLAKVYERLAFPDDGSAEDRIDLYVEAILSVLSEKGVIS